MSNQKMSTTITLAIWAVVTLCIWLLYVVANQNMTTIMKKSEMENLHASLKVETNIIEEYMYHQQDLLIAFSNSAEVRDFLKDPSNEEKKLAAQKHTENYYARMDNWEGLYIGEWDTHVIAHSNPDVVGMVTRTGEPLKELQQAMLSRKGLYNAGIIVSPASQQLILSLYCPVYDYDEETILGYVGGGPFASELRELLAAAEKETAKYYLINVNSGMYIFSQKEEEMATPIQDDMLLSIIDTLKADESKKSGDKEYTDSKEGKSIAVYQYIPEHGWAVVSCNSEDNIYADVDKNMRVLGVICIVSVVIIGLLSWILIQFSTRSLKHLEKSIVQLMELRIEERHNLDKYINHKSEVGKIATAIDSLYNSVKEMITAEQEKQLAIEASEAKARFLASMSHEIRTPIHTIIGMNEMILRENENETIEEYAYNLKSASQMLLALVNDVLDLSKLEAGKLQIVENNYRLASLINDAVLAIEARVKQKSLDLKLEIDESLPSVLKGDEIRIKQILNNLLSNAAKYTEEGSITFSVKGIQKENEFSLVLSVKDTGIGIREKDMEHLFESFSRLELEKNRYIEGTGLGLNITRQLVDGMNGSIEVESTYGIGSCFIVYLPQQVMDSTPIGEVITSIYQNRMMEKEDEYLFAPDAKVLVVDDNRMNLKVMCALLKRSQIQLDCATGGNECLQMTKDKKYDLILMDYMMPELDGLQTMQMIRGNEDNANIDTKIIVLTANANVGAAAEYINNGFDDYLAKPVVVEKLEEMLKKYLEK